MSLLTRCRFFVKTVSITRTQDMSGYIVVADSDVSRWMLKGELSPRSHGRASLY